MFPVLTVLAIIVGLLLIVLVLLQPGKGDLSATFGGMSSQLGSMFGMQKTADFLSKLTKILAIAILVIVIIANKLIQGGSGQEAATVKPVTEGAKAPVGNVAPPPIEAPKK